MYKFLRLSLFFLLCPSILFSQNRQYAKNTIDTLCSPAFFGRGYVQRGDSLAAEFIRGEFKSIGLQRVRNNYFQVFTHNVNSFPGNLSITFDDTVLKGGRQYLIDPASGSGDGKFKVENITFEDISGNSWLEKVKKSNRKVLAIDLREINKLDNSNKSQFLEFVEYLKFENDIPAKGIMLYQQGKIPWSVADREAFRPVFTVFKDSIRGLPEKVSFEVENEFIENYRSKNVIGFIPGKSDSSIVVTAHYDHLGMMGENYLFPGANDNASGIALMLDLASYFAENPLEYNLYFIAFAGEEAGLKGSQYFANNPLFSLNKVKFLLNIDLAGTGIDGATVVNGKVFKKEFELLKNINQSNNYLKTINARGEACNSDHCFFYQKGVKCFFIYTMGGTSYYHDIYDSPATLSLNEYENYFSLLREFLERL